MNHAKLDNIRLRAVNLAERLNDALDCDVIHEARQHLIDAKNDTEASEAFAYLETAIRYRVKNTEISELRSEYRKELVNAIFHA